MGYYLRFISRSELPDLEAISNGVRQEQPGFSLVEISADCANASVLIGDVLAATIELNRAGEELFEEEREELLELAQDGEGAVKEVSKTLKSARGIVALEVLFGGGDLEKTLDMIDPLISFLVGSVDGLIQADGEGFYRGNDLILETG